MSRHKFDTDSVTNPVTGRPYGPGPLWAGTEPMDYPDPTCVCGGPWLGTSDGDRCLLQDTLVGQMWALNDALRELGREISHRLTRGRVSVYIEPRDLWIGLYVGPNHLYLCPVPTLVIRWRRQ